MSPPAPKRSLRRSTRRAFRRPVEADDYAAPMSFYEDARTDGGSFDRGIQTGLARLLVSPSFLFRAEQRPGGPLGGRRAPDQRHRARLAALVLPLVEHPGR